MGRIYRLKLEKHDKLADGIYFIIVISIQVLIAIFNAGLAFGAVWVGSFANGPVVPYITVMTGIAFWLRVAKIVAQTTQLSEKLVLIGRNTYSVMMHHIAVFMLVKGIFYLCSCLTSLCAEFDAEMFFHDIGYVYLVGGTEASKWIYLLAGLGIPIFIRKWIEKIRLSDKNNVGM